VVDQFAAQRHVVAVQMPALEDLVDLALGVDAAGVEVASTNTHIARRLHRQLLRPAFEASRRVEVFQRLLRVRGQRGRVRRRLGLGFDDGGRVEPGVGGEG